MQSWKIIIAEDDRNFADALSRSLRGQADIDFAGTANDGVQAIELARITSPDIILVDIEMPIMNGIEVIRLLKKEKPSIEFIVLTVVNDSKVLRRALLAGAKSYLLKEEARSSLRIVEAIREVGRGGGSIPSSLAAPLLAVFDQPPAQSDLQKILEPLTATEREILEAIASGKSNQQIADSRYISVYTTKNHVARILEKLHASNRTEAARIALQSGLTGDISS